MAPDSLLRLPQIITRVSEECRASKDAWHGPRETLWLGRLPNNRVFLKRICKRENNHYVPVLWGTKAMTHTCALLRWRFFLCFSFLSYGASTYDMIYKDHESPTEMQKKVGL